MVDSYELKVSEDGTRAELRHQLPYWQHVPGSVAQRLEKLGMVNYSVRAEGEVIVRLYAA